MGIVAEIRRTFILLRRLIRRSSIFELRAASKARGNGCREMKRKSERLIEMWRESKKRKRRSPRLEAARSQGSDAGRLPPLGRGAVDCRERYSRRNRVGLPVGLPRAVGVLPTDGAVLVVVAEVLRREIRHVAGLIRQTGCFVRQGVVRQGVVRQGVVRLLTSLHFHSFARSRSRSRSRSLALSLSLSFPRSMFKAYTWYERGVHGQIHRLCTSTLCECGGVNGQTVMTVRGFTTYEE